MRKWMKWKVYYNVTTYKKVLVYNVSNAFFLYLRDPDGHRIEFYFGDYFTGDGDFEPKRWSVHDKTRQTFWGHEAPDSWFDEASPFINILTGEVIEKEKAKLTYISQILRYNDLKN